MLKRPPRPPVLTQASLILRLRAPVEPTPEMRTELARLLAALILDASARAEEVGDEAR